MRRRTMPETVAQVVGRASLRRRWRLRQRGRRRSGLPSFLGRGSWSLMGNVAVSSNTSYLAIRRTPCFGESEKVCVLLLAARLRPFLIYEHNTLQSTVL